MSKVSIELTEKVVFEFGKDEFKNHNTEHFPFEEFVIKFPMSVYLSKEQVVDDSLDRAGKTRGELTRKQLRKIEKQSEKYVEDFVYIHVTPKDNLSIKVRDSLDSLIFEFAVSDLYPIPIVLYNEFSSNSLVFSMKLLNLVFRTLEYINKPNENTTITERREPKRYKSKLAKRKAKKKHKRPIYITKKSYKIHDVDSDVEKRDYNRIRESWGVRGHWRHYRDENGDVKKKVWIEPHTRGEKKDEEPQEQEYKIANIKGEK